MKLVLERRNLKLSKIGNIYHLDGKWRDNDRTFLHCPTLDYFFFFFKTWFEKKVLDSISNRSQDPLVIKNN